MTVLTIRDVPEEVRDALASEAKLRGQSLQAFLLGVVKQQADFLYNRQVIVEIQRDLAEHGGLRPGDQTSAEIIQEERAERDRRLGDR